MDPKTLVIKRMATILRGGLQPPPYRGITVIGVADSLLKDVLDQAARALDPTFVPGPSSPPVRIKGGR